MSFQGTHPLSTVAVSPNSISLKIEQDFIASAAFTGPLGTLSKEHCLPRCIPKAVLSKSLVQLQRCKHESIKHPSN